MVTQKEKSEEEKLQDRVIEFYNCDKPFDRYMVYSAGSVGPGKLSEMLSDDSGFTHKITCAFYNLGKLRNKIFSKKLK